MSIFSLLAARSISIFETPACAKRVFERVAQLQVLVQQLRVVLVGEPARAPRLVEPEPESVRMNFLTHRLRPLVLRYALAFARPLGRRVFLRRRLSRAAALRRRLRPSASRRARRFGASPRRSGRQAATLAPAARRPARSGARSASRRGTRGPSGPGGSASATGPGWRSTPSTNSRSTSPPNPSFCDALAIAERSTFSMSRATPLRANCSVASACVHVAPANQIEHQPRLLRRGADVLRGGVRLNRHYAPAFGAPAAPGGAAAATAAALSLLVVCPLNCRVGANSPSLWPTMFSVT